MFEWFWEIVGRKFKNKILTAVNQQFGFHTQTTCLQPKLSANLFNLSPKTVIIFIITQVYVFWDGHLYK